MEAIQQQMQQALNDQANHFQTALKDQRTELAGHIANLEKQRAQDQEDIRVLNERV